MQGVLLACLSTRVGQRGGFQHFTSVYLEIGKSHGRQLHIDKTTGNMLCRTAHSRTPPPCDSQLPTVYCQHQAPFRAARLAPLAPH